MEDPILQELSRVLLHQRPRGAFLDVGGLGWPGCEHQAKDWIQAKDCCCSCCRSAISVGELGGRVPSNCLSARQLRYTVSVPPDSSTTLSPVPPDSSSSLSAGASRQLRYTVSWSVMTFLLPILLASTSFVGEWGGELRGSSLEAWMKSQKSEVAIT